MKYAHIETTDYDEEDALFFIRIKGKKQYFNQVYGERLLASLFGHISNKRTISEYRNANHYIDLDLYDVADFTADDYKIYYSSIHSDLPKIISQCRGLRNIPYADARDLIFRSTKFFIEFFRTHKYKIVVVASIDNYVLDILNRVTKHLGVNVICIQEWFVKGYHRHTVYGEALPFREVSNAEVDEVIQILRKDEPHFWLKNVTRFERFRYSLYLTCRYYILYFLRYIVQYRLLGNIAYEYRFANAWPSRFINLSGGRYFDHLKTAIIDIDLQSAMVVPLHVFPEQNVDYWMTDFRHADYYSSLFEAVSYFRSEGVTLFLKEHPGFLYQRETWVYKTLRRFENVRLIDPLAPDIELLDQIPTILVWHGSMGLEGLLRGRKVVAFDENYYSGNLVPSYKDYRSATPLNGEQAYKLVGQLLRCVFKV